MLARALHRSIAVLLFLALACGGALAADEDELYTVYDVTVDKTAASAAQAREIALAEAQAQAFDRLVRRLVPRERQAAVPRQNAQAMARLVRGFEVDRERSSNVRYIATLRFRFDAAAVRDVLRGAGVAFAETRSKPVVVVPVLMEGDAPKLFENPNPWRAAWAGQAGSDGLVPFMVPPGDAMDQIEIDAAAAATGRIDNPDAVLRRYGAGEVMIAVATPEPNSGGAVSITVAVTRGDREGGGAQVQSFSGESLALALRQAAALIAVGIEEGWKRDNLIRFDKEQSLIATVPIGKLEDWVAVRQRLTQVASLKSAGLVAFSRREAVVRLVYFGDEQQLKLALAQSDLALQGAASGWTIALASDARRPEGAR
jgi:hypothetical protein